MSTLLVMRHAKSDWDASYGADHERPLNERGERSARLMGRLLAAADLAPDLVISSTAVRARTTAELAIESGGWASPLVLEPALYGAGVDSTMDVVGEAPDVGSLMIVGHQPTWSAVVAEMTGSRVEMKTAAVAVIAADKLALVEVLYPREHFGGPYDR